MEGREEKKRKYGKRGIRRNVRFPRGGWRRGSCEKSSWRSLSINFH
jgi:hypothetical protein